MLNQIIKLLEENNNLLKQINDKLSQSSTFSSSTTSEDAIFGLPKEMLNTLAEQYKQNSDVVIQEDAQVKVMGGNLFIKSRTGRVNVNLSERNEKIKSSFIREVKQTGQRLLVKFSSGKTYLYQSVDKAEFNRVADLLLTTPYVSKPFWSELRNNRSFTYQIID